MPEQINTAVILAAGMGSRLGEHNSNKPKGFIKLGVLPIIHESMNKLIHSNLNNIIIVTGYKNELYDSYIKNNFSEVTIVKNLNYETTNTLFSLSKARHLILDDFLLLESDIIYDSRAIDALIDSSSKNTVLLSEQSGSGDEVFVETKNNILVNMSKDKADLSKDIKGEFVGINKISIDLYTAMMDYFDISENKNSLTYEEDALVHCSNFIDIECLKLDDLLWSEIDTKEHLEKARIIYKDLY